MTRIPMIALATSLLLSNPAAALSANLTVTIKNVRSTAGEVYVAVYDSGSSFLKLEQARAQSRTKACKGEVVLIFRDLPPGRYAVTAYHDENDNGRMDRNWLGIPTEGYGFSNDVRGAAGPPKFTQAAFGLENEADKSVSFSMKY